MSIINLEILLFDYIIISLTLVFIIFSFWKGFINSLLGILTWIGSVFITIFSYEYLSSNLNDILLNISFLKDFDEFVSILSILISIPLIFLISLFILKKLGKILNNDLDRKILGYIFDKCLGIIYGILFSYLIFSSVIYFTFNTEISILNEFNIFLIENSNILKEINFYNEKILNIYSKKIIE